MQTSFAHAQQRFGVIHGVVNAAGIEGKRGSIDRGPTGMFDAIYVEKANDPHWPSLESRKA